MVDEGMAKTTTTNTLKDDVYAFVFGQKGLMAGLGIQGNKIAQNHAKVGPSRVGARKDAPRRVLPGI